MLKVTLIKSPIASLPVHKATVAALGLRKVGQTVLKPSRRGFHHCCQASWPRRGPRSGQDLR